MFEMADDSSEWLNGQGESGHTGTGSASKGWGKARREEQSEYLRKKERGDGGPLGWENREKPPTDQERILNRPETTEADPNAIQNG